jgi:small-conductance mechanosensitive channel
MAKVGDVLNTRLFTISGTAITVSTALTLIIIVVGTIWLSRILRRAVERNLRRRIGAEGTVGAVGGLLHYAVLALGFAIALDTAGINLTALFAAGAVFAVGIGFAMQNIAQNFVSGVILLAERSIRPGDILEIEGEVVKILRMGIRATIVQNRDNESVIVPNSTLVQSSVTNYTLDDSVTRMHLGVGVVYSADMRLVHDTLLETAKAFEPQVAGREPEVLLVAFGDNSVNFDVAVWIGEPWRARALQSKLATAVWWALADKQITIAFPQLDLHLDPPVVKALERLGGRAA